MVLFLDKSNQEERKSHKYQYDQEVLKVLKEDGLKK